MSLVLLLFALAPLARAFAQDATPSVVVGVPPQLEPTVTAAEGARVVQAVGHRLVVDGYTWLSPGQAASAMGAMQDEGLNPTEGLRAPHECTLVECAEAFRELFAAEFAVQMTVMRRVEGEGPGAVAVTLVDDDGRRFTGQAEVQGGDVEVAALQALAAARKDREAGVAAVAEPPPAPAATAAPADYGAAGARRARRWDLAVGSSLVVLGAALASVVPALALSRDGECETATCDGRYDTRMAAWPALGGGLALIGGGVAILWARPFTARVAAGKGSAALVVGGQW